MDDLFAISIAFVFALIPFLLFFGVAKLFSKIDEIPDPLDESNSEDNFIYRGPRGGWFRINRNGRKSYDVKRPD
tara:strand:+ start:170 stop:391 length:222 start_codon:yes stop_codon:yes gene_type:complete